MQEVSEAMSSSKEEEVVPSSGGGWLPCAACQHLHLACGVDCVFAPHFPPGDDPAKFAAVHAVFGASRLATLLLDVPSELRGDVAASCIYEARCRQHHPALGVLGEIDTLNTALKLAEELLAATRKELARYSGEEATSRSFVPAHEPREVATKPEVEDGAQAAAKLMVWQSAADAVTNFVTPLHEKLVKDLTPDVPRSNTSVTAAVPGPAKTVAAAVAGVQDAGLPEAEGAGDEPSQGSA